MTIGEDHVQKQVTLCACPWWDFSPASPVPTFAPTYPFNTQRARVSSEITPRSECLARPGTRLPPAPAPRVTARPCPQGKHTPGAWGGRLVQGQEDRPVPSGRGQWVSQKRSRLGKPECIGKTVREKEK